MQVDLPVLLAATGSAIGLSSLGVSAALARDWSSPVALIVGAGLAFRFGMHAIEGNALLGACVLALAILSFSLAAIAVLWRNEKHARRWIEGTRLVGFALVVVLLPVLAYLTWSEGWTPFGLLILVAVWLDFEVRRSARRRSVVECGA